MSQQRWEISPILIKEMRSTMRGARTFVGITLFLLFLTGISLLIYAAVAQESYGPSSAESGRIIFGFLSVIEALMLGVLTPPLTSGAIANERQKQTFEMLMATPLTPRQVLSGKLLASMNYLFLLMFASLPINAIVFLFGGVGYGQLLWWFALVTVVLLMLGTLGLLMSTIFKNGGIATAMVYLLCIVFLVVGPSIILFASTLFSFSGSSESCTFGSFIAFLHPLASLMSIVVNEDELSPVKLLPATLPLYAGLAGLFFLGAEARLSKLAARPFHASRWIFILGLLVIIGIAMAYLALTLVPEIC